MSGIHPRTYLIGCALTGIMAQHVSYPADGGVVRLEAEYGHGDTDSRHFVAARRAVMVADAVLDLLGCCQYRFKHGHRCDRAAQRDGMCDTHKPPLPADGEGVAK